MSIPEPSEAHLKAIGRISVNFAQLEYLLRVSIAVLLGSDYDRGLLATSEMSYRQLVNLFVRLFERRFGMNRADLSEAQKEELAKFEAIVARMDQAATERNRVLHSSWYPLGASDRAVGQRWGKFGRTWYQPETEERSSDELNEIANRISAVRLELEAFIGPLQIEMDRFRSSRGL